MALCAIRANRAQDVNARRPDAGRRTKIVLLLSLRARQLQFDACYTAYGKPLNGRQPIQKPIGGDQDAGNPSSTYEIPVAIHCCYFEDEDPVLARRQRREDLYLPTDSRGQAVLNFRARTHRRGSLLAVQDGWARSNDSC